MKYLICIISILVYSTSVWAQGGIVAGVLTDENENPLSKATVIISKAQRSVEVHTDEDGLFYSHLLSADLYRIDVVIDGKHLGNYR